MCEPLVPCRSHVNASLTVSNSSIRRGFWLKSLSNFAILPRSSIDMKVRFNRYSFEWHYSYYLYMYTFSCSMSFCCGILHEQPPRRAVFLTSSPGLRSTGEHDMALYAQHHSHPHVSMLSSFFIPTACIPQAHPPPFSPPCHFHLSSQSPHHFGASRPAHPLRSSFSTPKQAIPQQPHDDVLIFSKFLNVSILLSRNRPTQFCTQLSSLLSSRPCLIVPVMHFLKHMAVRVWMPGAQDRVSICLVLCLVLLRCFKAWDEGLNV